MPSTLILGGYGNFGSRICFALAKANIGIIIAGRNLSKARELKAKIQEKYPHTEIDAIALDIHNNFNSQLKQLKPRIVVNTIGPFQTSDYSIPKACIENQIHYTDLADARDFVIGISSLNTIAKQQNVLVVSGASTVPALSSAIIDYYQKDFATIDSIVYGISPGQKAPRGLATAESILTYLGKPLKPYPGNANAYGWQDLYKQTYPELGTRWFANCDVPDLDIFPQKYGLKSIKFSAGMESQFLHFGMWLVSWFKRLGLPLRVDQHAPFLLRVSHLFDRFGTADGGMHMIIQGKDHNGHDKTVNYFIIAKRGDGPQIPCVPAIILVKKLISDQLTLRGAMPCVSLITLQEYLDELTDFAIQTFVTSS